MSGKPGKQPGNGSGPVPLTDVDNKPKGRRSSAVPSSASAPQILQRASSAPVRKVRTEGFTTIKPADLRGRQSSILRDTPPPQPQRTPVIPASKLAAFALQSPMPPRALPAVPDQTPPPPVMSSESTWSKRQYSQDQYRQVPPSLSAPTGFPPSAPSPSAISQRSPIGPNPPSLQPSQLTFPHWPLRAQDFASDIQKAMPCRTLSTDEMPRDVLIRRPAWYWIDTPGEGNDRAYARDFARFTQRRAYNGKRTLFGQDIKFLLLWLVDLEGAILNKEWLISEAIIAGLAFMLHDLEPLVYINTTGIFPRRSMDQSHEVGNLKRQMGLIRPKRFHVWPIHCEGNHWALGIYDAKTNLFRYWDSLASRGKLVTAARAAAWDLTIAYRRAGWDVPSITDKPMRTVQQTNGYACGLHVCENARYFLREAADDQSIEGDWTQSAMYPRISDQTPEGNETRMTQAWVIFCRLEFGSTQRLRFPSFPTVTPRDADCWNQGVLGVPNCLAFEGILSAVEIEEWLSTLPNPLPPEGHENFVRRTRPGPYPRPRPQALPVGPKPHSEYTLHKYDEVFVPQQYEAPDVPIDFDDVPGGPPPLPEPPRESGQSQHVTPKPKRRRDPETTAPMRTRSKSKEAAAANRAPAPTYLHPKSPVRHLSPDHLLSWKGWDHFYEQQEEKRREKERKSQEAQVKDRNARAEAREMRRLPPAASMPSDQELRETKASRRPPPITPELKKIKPFGKPTRGGHGPRGSRHGGRKEEE